MREVMNRFHKAAFEATGAVDSCLPIQITPAEKAVLRALMESDTNQEVAERLCVSRSTVRTHLRHLFDKFKVRSRTGLVVAAIRHGVLDLEELEESSHRTMDVPRAPPLSYYCCTPGLRTRALHSSRFPPRVAPDADTPTITTFTRRT